MGKVLLFLAATVLFSSTALATSPPPPHPGYASCPLLPAALGTQSTIDPGCKGSIDRNHQMAVNAHYTAQGMVTSGYDGKTPPPLPKYDDCQNDDDGSGGMSSAYAGCLNSNRQKQDAYGKQVQIFNAIQEDTKRIEGEKREAEKARTNIPTTTLLAEAENLNKDKAKKQQKMQILFMVGSAAAAAKFAASCSGGATCQWGWMALSIGLGVKGMLSGKQANEHDKSALNVCESYNNVAAADKPCSPVAPFDNVDLNNPSFPNKEIDAAGKCKPDAPPSCQVNRQAVIDANGGSDALLKARASGFAAPFKFNPDGTITAKNGKTYKPSDFESEQSMIDAGFSPADAKAAMAQMNSATSSAMKMAGIKEDLKVPITDKAALDGMAFGADGTGGSGGSGMNNGKGQDGAGKLGSKDMDGSGGRKRKLASDDGLFKDFNGDSIGIANDDIFKMMNKRYNLKSAQDTFIGN